MITYYQTDSDTGEIATGPHEARIDPRSQLPLYPRGAVLDPPPQVEPGYAAVWDGTGWTVQEDHRGLAGWVHDEPTTITELGPLPEGWSDAPPVIPEPEPSPIIHEVSKLTLMERLVALDKWDLFKTFFIQLPELTQDAWNLAQAIRSDHPLFLAHADYLKSALSLTDEEVNDLLAP